MKAKTKLNKSRLTWNQLKKEIDSRLKEMNLTGDERLFYIDLNQHDLSDPESIDVYLEEDGDISIF